MHLNRNTHEIHTPRVHESRYANFHRNIISIFLITLLLCVGCGGSDNNSSAGINDSSTDTSDSSGGTDDATNTSGLAKIYRDATYNVNIDFDVVYGQGLSHSGWNTNDGFPMDLKLDAYVPENDETRRPAMMFIHGGGFRGG